MTRIYLVLLVHKHSCVCEATAEPMTCELGWTGPRREEARALCVHHWRTAVDHARQKVRMDALLHRPVVLEVPTFLHSGVSCGPWTLGLLPFPWSTAYLVRWSALRPRCAPLAHVPRARVLNHLHRWSVGTPPRVCTTGARPG